MARTDIRYGWVRDLPDHRDHLFAAAPEVMEVLPTRVDLRAQCPDVLDQGKLGSCTANGIANAHLFDQMKQNAPTPFLPSRLFIYYNERAIEHTVPSDAGAMIRDGIKSIAHDGVCLEATWPYDIANFAEKPPAKAFAEAKNHQAVSYLRIPQLLNQMKGCLAAGYPFVYGFSVYDSFESDAVRQNGMMPMPAPSESLLGGHCVLAVGYDDASQRFIVMNSWNTSWGDKGYFYMPYAYITDPQLAADFWTVRVVEV